jgi:hypothetical protein
MWTSVSLGVLRGYIIVSGLPYLDPHKTLVVAPDAAIFWSHTATGMQFLPVRLTA